MQAALIRLSVIACYCLVTGITAQAADSEHDRLQQVLAGEQRSADNKARDVYRNPQKTLDFFGLESDDRVLEITPGSGWYTEILAPYLRDQGHLIVASFGSDHPVEYLGRVHDRYMDKLDADPASYGEVERVLFKEDRYLQAVADDSVDRVLTFRNTHNWIQAGEADAIYTAMFRVLKPCGTLGVTQHRAAEGTEPATSAPKGYVAEQAMIDIIEGAGFELAARSDINANPKDSRDHPEGVWSLPPTYRNVGDDRARYEAIGESDRMTLRFTKPAADSSCPDA